MCLSHEKGNAYLLATPLDNAYSEFQNMLFCSCYLQYGYIG